MSIDNIRKILEISAESGISSIKFTGGEPLLRGDICNILRIPKELGMRDLQMVTNGYLLKDYVDDIKESGIDLLTVSLDSLDRNKFKRNTGVDCLDTVKKGINAAADRDIKLRMNMVLTRSNIEELDSMLKFCNEVDAELKLLDLLEFQVPKNPCGKRNTRH